MNSFFETLKLSHRNVEPFVSKRHWFLDSDKLVDVCVPDSGLSVEVGSTGVRTTLGTDDDDPAGNFLDVVGNTCRCEETVVISPMLVCLLLDIAETQRHNIE